MTAKRIGFIINAAAGAGRCLARWAEWHVQFRPAGLHERLLFTARPGDAVRFAQELGRECDVVVAVGGDGTLCEVASGLLLNGASDALLRLASCLTRRASMRRAWQHNSLCPPWLKRLYPEPKGDSLIHFIN